MHKGKGVFEFLLKGAFFILFFQKKEIENGYSIRLFWKPGV